MPRRRWIKLWTQEAIQGTTRREMEPDERSVWWDFLALAGDSPDPGKICFYRNVPLTDDQLCQTLNISQDLLNRARGKMLKFGKITVNEGIIHIVNWERYQSEYERTKKYVRRSVENLQENLQTGQCRKSTKKSTLHQTRPDQTRPKQSNIKETGELLSPKQKELLNILLRCPAIKEADAYKLPELFADYPNVNHALEFKKFVEWWPGPKKRQKPWATLRNWLEKAQGEAIQNMGGQRYGKAREGKQHPKFDIDIIQSGDDESGSRDIS